MNLKEMLEKGYLIKEPVAHDLVAKELQESSYDLDKAKKALKDNDFKWSIIKSYYSMFHAGKALCFNCGYREKKHVAVLIFLEHLNKAGKLESEFVNYFSAAMDTREGADYRYTYSIQLAERLLNQANKFYKKIKIIIDTCEDQKEV